jgi:hypothetical protein
MERFDDVVEEAGAVVSPSGGVECQRKFGVAVCIDGGESFDDRRGARVVELPVLDGRPDGRPKPVPAVLEEPLEQLVPRPEVVGNASVGHPCAACDLTELDRLATTFAEKVFSGLEDESSGLLCRSSASRRHAPTLP